MSEAAREKWDARYGADGYEPNEEPVPFLRERVGDLGSGSALCLAAGTGRNAVFLAERGFAVTAVDISPRGLAWACALAQRRGVEIDIVDNEVRTQPRQMQNIGSPQAPGTARDQCHFTFEFHQLILRLFALLV